MAVVYWENIPPPLRTVPQWLVWREQYEPGRDKPLKVPVRLVGDEFHQADAGDPGTWMPFEQAVVYVQQRPELSGIGLCPKGVELEDGWKLAILDFDRVWPSNENNSQLPLWLRGIVNEYGLYAERSPSGTGVRSACLLPMDHPYVTGGSAYLKVFSPEGEHRGELFINGGYCTFTGDALRSPAEDPVPKILDLDTVLTVRTGLPSDEVHQLGAVPWDVDQGAFQLFGLSTAQQEVFTGVGGHDRSAMMLPLLAKLSWQCRSAEELAARAWQSPLQQYFVDHRRERGVEHQMAFCARECAKAWGARDQHAPIERKMLAAAGVGDPGERPVSPGSSPALPRDEDGVPLAEQELVWIKSAEDIQLPEPDWLVTDFLPERGTALIFSPANAGKSWIMVSLLAAIATGQKTWMDRHVMCEQGPTIYIASEGLPGAHKRAIELTDHRAKLFFHNELPRKLTPEMVQTMVHDLRIIEARHGPLRCAAIDTLIGHLVGSENSSEETEAWLGMVRAAVVENFSCPLLISHHTNRLGTMRGSSNFDAFFEAIWEIETPEEGSNIVTAKHVKYRDFAKTAESSRPVVFSIETQKNGEVYLRPTMRPAQPVEKSMIPPSTPPDEKRAYADQYLATEDLIYELVKEGKLHNTRATYHHGEYEAARRAWDTNRGPAPFPAKRTNGQGKDKYTLAPVIRGLIETGQLEQNPKYKQERFQVKGERTEAHRTQRWMELQ